MASQNKSRNYTLELIRRVSGNNLIDLDIKQLKTIQKQSDNNLPDARKIRMWAGAIIDFKLRTGK